MANYASLKEAIQQVVKTNGNNEITGALLQQTLIAMVNSLGVNYQFAGIATPSTNPGTPDQNVFYLASTAGTYTNFNGLSVSASELAILKFNGSWTKDALPIADPDAVNSNTFTNYGFPRLFEYVGSIETTNLIEYGAAKYRVIPVIGGEKLIIRVSYATRIAILSDFQFNPALPYDFIFASGETGRRQVNGTIELTLPQNAKYILVQTMFSDGVERQCNTLTLNGVNYLIGDREFSEQIRKETYNPYFSTDKKFGFDSEINASILRNSLIKCVWYEDPGVQKIGVRSFQISGNSLYLWFANCDNISGDALIPTTNVIGRVEYTLAQQTGVQKFEILRSGSPVGFVIIDFDLFTKSTEFITSTTPVTFNNSGLSFVEIYNPEKVNFALAEAKRALQQSQPVMSLNWGVNFDGVNSGINANTPIVLSQDGDELEFEVYGIVPTSMGTGGYAFTKGNAVDEVRGLFITKTKMGIRADDGTWISNNGIVLPTTNTKKIKVSYSSGNINVYGNDELLFTYTGQKTITILGFGNGVTTGYPDYWGGVVNWIKLNQQQLSFADDFQFVGNAKTYRSAGFLTDEQAEQLAGNSSGLYASKTATKMKLYKKLFGNLFVMYPFEYRQRSFTAGQYPSYYDNWGIGQPMLCNYDGTLMNEIIPLFDPAEAELAVEVPDANNAYTFVGGAMHGFENITQDGSGNRNIRILINGVKIDETAIFDLTPIVSADMLQESELCVAYTNTNPFSRALKHWVFDDNGLRITTQLTLLRAITFRRAMFGMMGVFRHWGGISTNDYLTNRAIKNNHPFTIYDISDGWESQPGMSVLSSSDNGCTEIKTYGQREYGFALEILDATTKPNGGMFIATNGGQPYNKIYFNLTGLYNAENSEILKATQVWHIE